jgi:uncharacterized protein YdcH (DUF465 family)
MDDTRIKEILLQQNKTFKELSVEHQKCDRQLNEISLRNMKTDSEMIREKNLKKQKLKIKDSMQRFIFEYRKGVRQTL